MRTKSNSTAGIVFPYRGQPSVIWPPSITVSSGVFTRWSSTSATIGSSEKRFERHRRAFVWRPLSPIPVFGRYAVPIFTMTVSAPRIAAIQFSGPWQGEFHAADEVRLTFANDNGPAASATSTTP